MKGIWYVRPHALTRRSEPAFEAEYGELGAYGEVSFQGSGDASVDRGYGTKLGLKYNF